MEVEAAHASGKVYAVGEKAANAEAAGAKSCGECGAKAGEAS